MEIIKLLPNDNEYIAKIIEIEADYSSCALSDMLLDKSYTYYIAKSDEFLGYLLVKTILDECEVIKIYVIDKYRNKKIATKIIEKFKLYCKENGILKVFLEVRESNVNAIKLYKNTGFLEYAKRKNYYKNPLENAVLMLLEVK